ncbi:DUF3501 family protein [Anaeromyxobacter diazotrophicus]|uniref:DUF3501 family protein n=1 Tax=Anaeromyxobacter diazotrophicus TaxID=2590199 RepID=A0A7I9VIY7_9BACT|nr:DUF3501 family protein [Anaeromyxobacter diazotrophicus]GEJ56149.1 hypothetical protein AMYX_08900 [Anaeromyxobacter diazotrophicus]
MKVQRSELLPLETYDARRAEVRARVLEVKQRRRVHAGPLTFLFENADTVRYQVQEMARAERLFREEELQHELDTYNELLGGPGELGCSLLIELAEPAERDAKLRAWVALPRHLYAKLADGRRVRARYDDRQVGDDRLSSVQYLKFPVGPQAPVAIGSDLPGLEVEAVLTEAQRAALQEDLAVSPT